MDSLTLYKKARLCSDHFSPAHMYTNSVRRTLLPFAVPTLNPVRPIEISTQASVANPDSPAREGEERYQSLLGPDSPELKVADNVRQYSRKRCESPSSVSSVKRKCLSLSNNCEEKDVDFEHDSSTYLLKLSVTLKESK